MADIRVIDSYAIVDDWEYKNGNIYLHLWGY